MLRVRTATRCLSDPVLSHRAPTRPVAAQRNVRVCAAFDESPKEPITPAQKQISQELMTSMESSIGKALEAEKVSVTDVYGDNQHVCINVVSTQFEGQTAVKRQRLVYKVCKVASLCPCLCR